MRVSTYEIFLPLIDTDGREIDGKALLVNGLYGALDVVGKTEALKLRAGKLGEIPPALQERLALRGHITEMNESEELANALLLGRLFRMLIGFGNTEPVILPTYNCNFRCPYCFERHRLTHGKEFLERQMTPEMVDAVFSALQKQRGKGRRIERCTLYGGEPLLRENMATVRHICERAKAMGLALSAVTNGYDLDTYAEILEEFDFRQLQITVDGVGKLNDRRRLHRDGLPTYDRILKNAELALQRGVDVVLRVNVNGENIGGIRDLLEDLAAKGLKETSREERDKARSVEEELKKAGRQGGKKKGFFSCRFKAVSEERSSPMRVTERQVLDAIIAAGIPTMEAMERQSQYSMLLDGLLSAMSKEKYPDFSTAYCGAENGMLCAGPDGLLYPCWDLVAMEEQSVGFTDVESERFLFNFLSAKWRTRTSDLMEPCRRCPFIFICRGGCASEANRVHGDCFRGYCGEIKEIFAFVASRAVGKKWKETREEELSLSLAAPLSRLNTEERELLMHTQSRQDMFDIAKQTGIIPAKA